MICTEYAYKHLSCFYVIRRDLVHVERVMRVLSVGIVCFNICYELYCILLSAFVGGYTDDKAFNYCTPKRINYI